MLLPERLLVLLIMIKDQSSEILHKSFRPLVMTVREKIRLREELVQVRHFASMRDLSDYQNFQNDVREMRAKAELEYLG